MENDAKIPQSQGEALSLREGGQPLMLGETTEAARNGDGKAWGESLAVTGYAQKYSGKTISDIIMVSRSSSSQYIQQQLQGQKSLRLPEIQYQP